MKYILFVGLLITSYSASATLYKCKINDVLIFSQFPCSNKPKIQTLKSADSTKNKSQLKVTQTSHLSKVEYKLGADIKNN